MADVIIYQDINFGGPNQQLAAGSYDVKSLQIGNDQLTSLKIPDGLVVTLFADAGFTGATKTFTADTAYVGDDFNDLTSSIRIGNVAQAVTIFQDANFQGASQVLTPGLYNLASLQIGNDQLSSVKIPAGMRVSLFSDANFKGNVKNLTADTPFVGGDFNDLTSSIEVVILTEMEFSGPIVFDDGIAITAAYKIRLFQNGNSVFSLHVHDSTKLESYDYGIIVVIPTPDKTAYTFDHQGHVSNVFLGSVHDDNPIINTTNPAITANWHQIVQAGTPVVRGTADPHFLGEGWEATALQIAETVGQILIKVAGSLGGESSGGGGGNGSGDGGSN